MDQSSSEPAAESMYVAMRRLLASIDKCRDLGEALRSHKPQEQTLLQAVSEKAPVTPIRTDVLVYLLALHDRLTDVLRLSTAILRSILDPSRPFRMPDLTPISPLEDSVPGLESERATIADIERWVTDDYMWSQMTGEHVYSAAQAEAAKARYPEWWYQVESAAHKSVDGFFAQHRAEFERIVAAQGFPAAFEWMRSVIIDSD